MTQNIVQTEIKKFTDTICEPSAIKGYAEVFEFIDNTYTANPDFILNVYTQLVIHFAIGKPDCEPEQSTRKIISFGAISFIETRAGGNIISVK